MPLNEKDKYTIIILSEMGHTHTYIANTLNINRKTVETWINRYNLEKNVNRKEGSGRPKKTSIYEDNKIINIIKSDKRATCKKIKKELENENIILSESTIANRLNNNGFIYKKPVCKPLLSDEHKTTRLKWAEENIDRDWTLVVFSDESSVSKGPYNKFRWVDTNNKDDTDKLLKHPELLKLTNKLVSDLL